jgi:hypothetical protein
MQATARMASVVSSALPARRRLIRNVGQMNMTSADLQRSIVLSILVVPLIGAVFALPPALFLVAAAITSAPWPTVLAVAVAAAATWFIWRALRHPQWWMTSIFICFAIAPIFFWFLVRPNLESEQFRNYRQIPKEDKIVYYKQSYGRDMDRFALIEIPESRIDRSSSYRPVPLGVTATVEAISSSLNIPNDRLPNLSKASIRYYGGENENSGDDSIWMFLSITDIETRQYWIMESGY